MAPSCSQARGRSALAVLRDSLLSRESGLARHHSDLLEDLLQGAGHVPGTFGGTTCWALCVSVPSPLCARCPAAPEMTPLASQGSVRPCPLPYCSLRKATAAGPSVPARHHARTGPALPAATACCAAPGRPCVAGSPRSPGCEAAAAAAGLPDAGVLPGSDVSGNIRRLLLGAGGAAGVGGEATAGQPSPSPWLHHSATQLRNLPARHCNCAPPTAGSHQRPPCSLEPADDNSCGAAGNLCWVEHPQGPAAPGRHPGRHAGRLCHPLLCGAVQRPGPREPPAGGQEARLAACVCLQIV